MSFNISKMKEPSGSFLLEGFRKLIAGINELYKIPMRLQIIHTLIFVTLTVVGCAPKTSQEYCSLGYKKMFNPKTQSTADSMFRKALQLDSNNHRAYFLLGDMYRMKWYSSKNIHDLNECRNSYSMAISLDSLNPQYLYFLGDTYEKQGVVKISSDTINVHPELLRQAIFYFDKSITVDSNYEGSYYGRSYCYNYLGDTISSLSDLKKSCSLGNDVSCFLLKQREK